MGSSAADFPPQKKAYEYSNAHREKTACRETRRPETQAEEEPDGSYGGKRDKIQKPEGKKYCLKHGTISLSSSRLKIIEPQSPNAAFPLPGIIIFYRVFCEGKCNFLC